MARACLLALAIVSIFTVCKATSPAVCTATPQRNITLDQVFGRWYIAESYGPYDVYLSVPECFDAIFTPYNATTFTRTETNYSIPIYLTLEKPEEPWLWKFADGRIHYVTYLSADNAQLGISGCIGSSQSPYVTLLSKRTPLTPEELQRAHDALSATGSGWDEKHARWLSEETCGSA